MAETDLIGLKAKGNYFKIVKELPPWLRRTDLWSVRSSRGFESQTHRPFYILLGQVSVMTTDEPLAVADANQYKESLYNEAIISMMVLAKTDTSL